MPITKERLLQIAESKGIDTSKYRSASSAPVAPANDINSLINKALGYSDNVFDRALTPAMNYNKRLIGETPSGVGGASGDLERDIAKTYLGEAIKRKFEDPTVRQLREAEIEALETPPPQGFLRIGRQIHPDPNYIKPEEQRKIDEAASIDQKEADAMRQEAQSTLGIIGKVKSGSKFFGPFGDIPSKYAPSSFAGLGNYKDRATWEANLKTLVSKKFLETITKLKDLSKTGATGLGPLTEKEGQRLLEASTALNANLPPEEAISLLNDMEAINNKILGHDVSQVPPDSPTGVQLNQARSEVPTNASFFSQSTGKYYDEEGNELSVAV